MRSFSFTSDERGMEPHSDLVALPLVVGGFVLFLALLASALQAWDEQTQGQSCAQDALQLAQAMRKAWLPREEPASAVLDARALDEAQARPGYLDDMCPQCDGASVRVLSSTGAWEFGSRPQADARCAYLAVAVRLDIARCEPAVVVVCLGGAG